jgi:hypothetical protein
MGSLRALECSRLSSQRTLLDSDSFGSCGAVQTHPLATTPPITVVGIEADQHPSGYFETFPHSLP